MKRLDMGVETSSRNGKITGKAPENENLSSEKRKAARKNMKEKMKVAQNNGVDTSETECREDA